MRPLYEIIHLLAEEKQEIEARNIAGFTTGRVKQ